MYLIANIFLYDIIAMFLFKNQFYPRKELFYDRTKKNPNETAWA